MTERHIPADASTMLDVVMPLLAFATDGWPEVIVSGFPDQWPTTLLPPEHATVVGAMKRRDSLTALLRFPESSEDPLREYCALIAAKGWHQPPPFPRGSFALSSPGSRPAGARGAVYCNGPFIVSIGTRADQRLDRLMSVTVQPCEGFPCVGDEHRHPAFATRGLIPRLVVDEGGHTSGVGQCGAGDHTTYNMRLVSDKSPEDLLPMIGSQLARAGWKLSAATTANGVAAQWVEKTDGPAVWRGILGIFVNGKTRDVFIHLTQAT